MAFGSLAGFFHELRRRAQRKSKSTQQPKKRARLALETLEQRLAPANKIWDGVADSGTPSADFNWSTATNWVGDAAPQPGDNLIFPADVPQALRNTVNDFVDYHFSGIQIDAFTLTPNPAEENYKLGIPVGASPTTHRIILGVPSGVDAGSPGAIIVGSNLPGGRIDFDIHFGGSTGAGSFQLNQTGSELTVLGGISSAPGVGLVKVGPGTLTLAGDNADLLGDIDINAGAIRVTSFTVFLTLGNPVAGSTQFRITAGANPTGVLTYFGTTADRTNIENELNALASIGAGNATVADVSPGVFAISFRGPLYRNGIPTLSAAVVTGTATATLTSPAFQLGDIRRELQLPGAVADSTQFSVRVGPEVTAPIPYTGTDADIASIQAAIDTVLALPTFQPVGGTVSVTGSITSVNVSAGGSYTLVPTVTFTGGGGFGATGVAIMSGSQVVGVQITNIGSGYTSLPTVTFTRATGDPVAQDAAATAVFGQFGLVFGGRFIDDGLPVMPSVSGLDSIDAVVTSGAGSAIVDSYDATVQSNAQLRVDMAANGAFTERLRLNGFGGDAAGALVNTSSTTSTVTWTGNMVLDDDQGVAPNVTIGVGTASVAAGTLVIRGVISDDGTVGLVKDGRSKLLLEPYNTFEGNTYGGATIVEAGMLSVAHPFALGEGGNSFNSTVVNHSLDKSGTLALEYTNKPDLVLIDTQYSTFTQLQTLTLTNVVADTSRITLSAGNASATAILYTGVQATDEANIKAALESLSTLRSVSGTADVMQIAPGVFEVVFGGGLAGLGLPLMSASVTAGPGAASVMSTAGAIAGFKVPDELLTLNGWGMISETAAQNNQNYGIYLDPRNRSWRNAGPGSNPDPEVTGTLQSKAGENSWEQNITLWSPGTTWVAGADSLNRSPTWQQFAGGFPDFPKRAVTFGAVLGSSLTINGVVEDFGIGATNFYSLAKVGFGRVILTNSNDFDGDIDVLQGALNIRDSNALGTNTSDIAFRHVWYGTSLELQSDDIPDSITSLRNAVGTITTPNFNLLIPSTRELRIIGPGWNNEGALYNVSGVNTIDADVAMETTGANPSTAIGVAADPDPFNVHGNSWNNLSQLIINGVLRGTNTSLSKIGLGELVLTNANTYSNFGFVGSNAEYNGANVFEPFGLQPGQTFINQGWITVYNDDALGTYLLGLGPTVQPGANVTAGAALHLKQHTVAEVQQFGVTGASVGTTRLNITFNGETTWEITWTGTDADTEAIRRALNALPSIGGSGAYVSVTGDDPLTGFVEPFEVTFRGALAGVDVPLLVPAITTLPGFVDSPALVIADGSVTDLNLNENLALYGGTGIIHRDSWKNQTGALVNLAGDNVLRGEVLLTPSIKIAFTGALAGEAFGAFTIEPGAVNPLTGRNPHISSSTFIPGGNGVDSVQLLSFGKSITGGNFRLRFFDGTTAQVSNDIPFPIPYDTQTLINSIQSALNAMTIIGANNTVVTAHGDVGIGIELDLDPALGGFAPLSSLTTIATISDLRWITNAQTDTGGIIKLGSQRMAIQGPGTYHGVMDIRQGALRIQNDTALGTTTNGTVVTTGAALELAPTTPTNNGNIIAGLEIWGEQLTLNGPGNSTFGLAPLAVLSHDHIWHGPISIRPAVTITFTGALANRAMTAVTVSNNGLLGSVNSITPTVTTLGGGGVNAVHTLSFGSNITGGAFRLQFDRDGIIQETADINWSPTPSVLVENIQNALDALAILGMNNTRVAADAPLIDVYPHTRFTIAGVIDDSTSPMNNGSDLAVQGSGELALLGTNVYRGTTFVRQGVLTMMNSRALGVGSVEEQQVLTLTGIGTQFALTFNQSTTPAITYTGTAGDAQAIQNALNALAGIGGVGGSVLVTSSTPGVFDIRMRGNLAGFNQDKIATGIISGAGTATVTTLVDGAGGTEVSNGAQIQISGSITVAGEPLKIQGVGTANQPEVQTIEIGAARIGSPFTLTFGGFTTIPLEFGATAAQVQAAVNSLQSVIDANGFVNVYWTSSNTYQFIFRGGLNGTNQLQITSSGISEVRLLRIVGAAPFTSQFTVTFDGATTAPITYNPATAAADIQFALNNLSTIQGVGGSVTVTAVAGGTDFEIAFGGSFTGTDVTLAMSGTVTFGAGSIAPISTLVVGSPATPATVHEGGIPIDVPFRWFSIGPASTTDTGLTAGIGQQLSGRITGVTPDPTDPNVIYVATADGGNWKTVDGGITWTQLFDFNQPLSSEIQRITIPSTSLDGSYTLDLDGAVARKIQTISLTNNPTQNVTQFQITFNNETTGNITYTGDPFTDANSILTALSFLPAVANGGGGTVSVAVPPETNVALTSTIALNSQVVTVTSTSQLRRGMFVTGFGIPANTVIQTVDSATQLTLSNPATNNAFTFLTYAAPVYVVTFGGNWDGSVVPPMSATVVTGTGTAQVGGIYQSATAAEVQDAINALPTVAGVGGSATVTLVPGLAEQQAINFDNAVNGTTQYTLTFNGQTTPLLIYGGINARQTFRITGAVGAGPNQTVITFSTSGPGPVPTGTSLTPFRYTGNANADAAAIVTSFQSIPGFGAGNVTVLPDYTTFGPNNPLYTVTFTGNYAGRPVNDFVANQSGGTPVTITGPNPGVLPYVLGSGAGQDAANIERELNALTSIRDVGGFVTVVQTSTNIYTVTFRGSLGVGDQPSITGNTPTFLVPAPPNVANPGEVFVNEVTAGIETAYVVAFGGSFTQQVVSPLVPIGFNGANPQVITTVEGGLGLPRPIFGGAMAVAPSDPRIIYFATGEGNNSADSFYGNGIYKSTDAGHTWQLLLDLNSATPNPFERLAINKIVVDNNPTPGAANPHVIFVAASDQATNGINGPGVANRPTEPNPGIWRFDGTSWINLTNITSTGRNSVISATGAPLGFDPPGTPGPDDDYTFSFPQRNASWTDLQLVYNYHTGNGFAANRWPPGNPSIPPKPILYATLGSTPGIISAASNPGQIVITTPQAHGLTSGQRIRTFGALGNTNASGAYRGAQSGDFSVSVLTPTTFAISDWINGAAVTGNGGYLGGGYFTTGEIITTIIDNIITNHTPHGLVTGDTITITNVQEAPVVNGTWQVTVISPTVFQLQGNSNTVDVAVVRTGAWTKKHNAVFRLYDGDFGAIDNGPLAANSTTNRPTWYMGDFRGTPPNIDVPIPDLRDPNRFPISYDRGAFENPWAGMIKTVVVRSTINVATLNNTNVYSIVARPGDGSFLSLQRSLDGGKNWQEITANLPQDFMRHGSYNADIIGFRPTSAGTSQTQDVVYISGRELWPNPTTPTRTNQVFVSTDSGATWTDISIATGNGNSPRSNAHESALDVQGRLLLATDGGLWRYDPVAQTWTDLNGTLAITQFNSVAAHPTSINLIIGGTQSNGAQIYTGQQVWNVTDPDQDVPGQANVTLVAYDPKNPQVAYHIRNGVLEKSLDSGNSWTSVISNFAGAQDNVYDFLVDRVRNNRLLAGTNRTLFENTNFGNSTWTNLTPGIAVTHVAASVLQGSFTNTGFPSVTDKGAATYDPDTIYVTNGSNIRLTKNHGITSWVNRDAPLIGGLEISDLVVDPFNRDTVYVTTKGTAGGAITAATSSTLSAVVVTTALPHGLATGDQVTIKGMVDQPTRPGVAIGNGAWTITVLSSTTFRLEGSLGNGITYDPAFGRATWSAAIPERGRVLMSVDAGLTWTDESLGLPDLPVWKLVIDPRTNSLYLGNDIGVYRKGPGDLSWQRMGEGLPTVAVHDIDLNLNFNVLTAGTYGRSVFQFHLDDVQANSGALRTLSGANNWNGAIIFTGATTIRVEGTPNANINVLEPTQLTVVGTISDVTANAGFQFDKTGLGTLTLRGANTYTGVTDIQEGIITVGNAKALGSSTAGTIVRDGTALQLESSSLEGEPLQLFGHGFVELGHATGALRNISGANTYTGTITLATDATIGVNSGTTLTIGTLSGLAGIGAITDGGNVSSRLNKELTGTLVLGSANSYNGLTEIIQGIVQIQDKDALGTSTSPTNVYNDAQLQLRTPTTGPNAGQPIIVASESLRLTGTGISNDGALVNVAGNNVWQGPIILAGLPGFAQPKAAAGTVAFGVTNPAERLTIDGIINQDVDTGLTKVGQGRLVLTKPNAFSGTTYVNAGVLTIQDGLALGDANTDEVQRVTTLSPTITGTFTLTFKGQTTAPIAFGAADVGISAIQTVNVFGGAAGSTRFALTFNGQTTDDITFQGLDEVQTLSLVGAAAGSTRFRLTFNGQTTPDLTYTGNPAVDSAVIEAALTALTTIGSGNVTVRGGGTGSIANFAITFRGALATTNVSAITAVLTNTPGTITMATALDGGQVPDDAAVVQAQLNALSTIGGLGGVVNVTSNTPGTYTVAFGGAFASLNVTTLIAGVTFGGGFATAFTTQVGSANGSVQAALNALSTIGLVGGFVDVTAMTPTPDGTSFIYTVTFLGTLQGSNEIEMFASGGVTGTLAAASTVADGGVGATVATGATLELDGDPLGTGSNFTVAGETIFLNGAGVAAGGALRNVSGNNTWTGNVSLQTNSHIGVDTTANTNELTISGIVQDAVGSTTPANLTKVGTGALIFPSANTYGGVTFINVGVINARHPQALGITPSEIQNIRVSGSSGTFTLSFNGQTTSPLPFNIAPNGGVLPTDSMQNALNDLPSIGALDQQRVNVAGSAGTFTITFNGATTNPVAFNQSLLQVETELNQLPTIGGVGGFVTVTGIPGNSYLITFRGSLAGFDQTAITAQGAGGAATTITNVKNGGVGGAVTVTQTGQDYRVVFGGTLAGIDVPTIIGIPSGGAGTTISTVQQGGSGGTDVANNASLQLQGGFTVNKEALTLRGNGPTSMGALDNVSGSHIWTAPITLAADASIGVRGLSDTLTFQQPVGQTGGQFGVTKLGIGTLEYQGRNSYRGVTRVHDGTLLLNVDNSTLFGEAIGGNLEIGNGDAIAAAVRWLFPNQMIDSGNVTVFSDGLLDLNDRLDPFNSSEIINTLTIVDGVARTGTVVGPGAGNLSISSSLTMTGGTLTANGTVTLQGAAAVTATSSATGPAVINGGGTLAMGSSTRTFAVSDGPNANTVDLRVDARLSGGAGISKTQNGLMAINNPSNPYPGTTTINTGVIQVNGQIGNVQINGSTAELGGTGTVGAITSTSGRVNPGASPGTLTTTGNVSWNATTTYFVDLEGDAPGTFDQLAVTGTINLNNAALAGAVGPGALDAGDIPIITATVAVVGQLSDPAIGPISNGGLIRVGGVPFVIKYTPNSVIITPAVHQPTITDAVTDEDTQTIDGLVVDRNPLDSAVTHFKITDIQNGTLYQNDGVTVINVDDFITYAQGLAGLKFTPDANFFGDGTVAVRASLSADDTGVGGNPAIATITVLSVNDAPVLDAGASPTLTPIQHDDTNSPGDLVSDIVVDGSITDADVVTAPEAIAVTTVDNTNGVWQYDATGTGSNWTDFTPVTGAMVDISATAVLLGANSRIRFVPNPFFGSIATFTFVAWDETSGLPGDTADLSQPGSTGGATPFSVESNTASITVINLANDAPILNASFSPILTMIFQGNTTSPGDTVAAIVVDGSITDPDGAAVEAIAVIGVDNTNGFWQYDPTGAGIDANFVNFTNSTGIVNLESTAFLMDTNYRIRFVPTGSFAGTATFTFRAWDKTTGAAGATVDLSLPGTTGNDTAFSVASDVATITVGSNTQLTSSAEVAVVGSTVTFSATINPSTATGTVVFKSFGTVIGSAPINNGVAQLTVSSLTQGQHNITAEFNSSVSNILFQQIVDMVNLSQNGLLQTVSHNSTAGPVDLLQPNTLTPTQLAGLNFQATTLESVYKEGFTLDQIKRFQLTDTRGRTLPTNRLRLGEKWIYATGLLPNGRAENKWYIIVLSGEFANIYLYRSRPTFFPPIATLSRSVYDDPSRLTDAAELYSPSLDPAAGTLVFNNGQMTVVPQPGASGPFRATVTLTDAQGGQRSSSFITNVTNNNPVMSTPITSIDYPASNSIDLDASDADNDSLTFTAVWQGYNEAYRLDLEKGFILHRGGLRYNIRGAQEKWLWSEVERKWYILVNWGGFAELRQWKTRVFNSPLIARLDPIYWQNPELLYNASLTTPPAPSGITATFTGDLMTFNIPGSFTGQLQVTVTAHDGFGGTSERTFLVNAGNQAPVINSPNSDSSMTSGTTLSLPVSATDPDNNPLTPVALVMTTHEMAFLLDSQLLLNDAGAPFSAPTPGAKFFFSGISQKYYSIESNGDFREYDNAVTNRLITRFDTSFYNDTLLISRARRQRGRTIFGVSSNAVTATPPVGYVGTLIVDLSVSDGILSGRRVILVTVS